MERSGGRLFLSQDCVANGPKRFPKGSPKAVFEGLPKRFKGICKDSDLPPVSEYKIMDSQKQSISEGTLGLPPGNLPRPCASEHVDPGDT